MELVKDYLETILVAVGVIIWGTRLEGKVQQNEKANAETQKDVDDLRINHTVRDGVIVEQLTQVRESLARLEGRLGITKDGDK